MPEAKILLKSLRESARPYLSIRRVADKLGVPASSYAHYERDFKGERLPLNLVEQLAPIFAEHGIPQERTIALSGAPDIKGISVPDKALLGLCLRAVEEMVAEQRLAISSEEKADVTLELYESRTNNPDLPLKSEVMSALLRHLSKGRAPSE